MQLDWVKKNQGLTIAEKRQCIDPAHAELSVTEQCQLLDLSRSSYYYHPSTNPEKEAIMRAIDEHYNIGALEPGKKWILFWVVARWLWK